jgi:DNA-directed RNA polymerase specialized sigma24 family protein
VFGVARFVLLESARQRERDRAALSELREEARRPSAIGAGGAGGAGGEDLACLERCLAGLSSDAQSLIVDYYGGEGRRQQDHRKALADRLGISSGALKVRAHRARTQLEDCMRGCLQWPQADRG